APGTATASASETPDAARWTSTSSIFGESCSPSTKSSTIAAPARSLSPRAGAQAALPLRGDEQGAVGQNWPPNRRSIAFFARFSAPFFFVGVAAPAATLAAAPAIPAP